MAIHAQLSTGIPTWAEAVTEAEKAPTYTTDRLASLWDRFVAGCVNLAWRLVVSLVLVLVGILIIRLLVKLINNKKLVSKVDPLVHTFLISAVRILCWAIILISVVSVLGVETASVVTVVASAGAALALALQGALSNLAGGIMLLIFRPFRVNDYIEVSGNGGTVTEVGIFYTVLIAPDKREITVPNGTMISAIIVNYSHEKLRRVDLTLDVAYGTDVERAKDIIRSVVTAHPGVKEDPPCFIRMTEMAESSLRITVRVFVTNADYWDVRFDLNEQIHKALTENGIQIPYQQMDVHIKND